MGIILKKYFQTNLDVSITSTGIYNWIKLLEYSNNVIIQYDFLWREFVLIIIIITIIVIVRCQYGTWNTKHTLINY